MPQLIEELEGSQEARDAMLAVPFLAEGALERYFSWRDDVGGVRCVQCHDCHVMRLHVCAPRCLEGFIYIRLYTHGVM